MSGQYNKQKMYSGWPKEKFQNKDSQQNLEIVKNQTVECNYGLLTSIINSLAQLREELKNTIQLKEILGQLKNTIDREHYLTRQRQIIYQQQQKVIQEHILTQLANIIVNLNINPHRQIEVNQQLTHIQPRQDIIHNPQSAISDQNSAFHLFQAGSQGELQLRKKHSDKSNLSRSNLLEQQSDLSQINLSVINQYNNHLNLQQYLQAHSHPQSALIQQMPSLYNQTSNSNKQLRLISNLLQPNPSEEQIKIASNYMQYHQEQQNSQMWTISKVDFDFTPVQPYPPLRVLQMISPALLEMDMQLTQGKLLYCFPKMKDINFHQCIDHHPNLFILLQLQNNHLLGGFTKLPFDPTPVLIPKQNPCSFLCNLTHSPSRFVFAHRVNKTLSYDRNYLLMGNWEIKVKVGEDKVECNWGGRGDSFRKKHYKGRDMVGQSREWLVGERLRQKQVQQDQHKDNQNQFGVVWYNIYCFK